MNELTIQSCGTLSTLSVQHFNKIWPCWLLWSKFVLDTHAYQWHKDTLHEHYRVQASKLNVESSKVEAALKYGHPLVYQSIRNAFEIIQDHSETFRYSNHKRLLLSWFQGDKLNLTLALNPTLIPVMLPR